MLRNWSVLRGFVSSGWTLDHDLAYARDPTSSDRGLGAPAVPDAAVKSGDLGIEHSPDGDQRILPAGVYAIADRSR